MWENSRCTILSFARRKKIENLHVCLVPSNNLSMYIGVEFPPKNNNPLLKEICVVLLLFCGWGPKVPPPHPSLFPARSLAVRQRIWHYSEWHFTWLAFRRLWHYFRNPIVQSTISASSKSVPVSITLVLMFLGLSFSASVINNCFNVIFDYKSFISVTLQLTWK